MDPDDLREVRDALEADLRNVNNGRGDVYALQQEVSAITNAFRVLAQLLIDDAERVKTSRKDK